MDDLGMAPEIVVNLEEEVEDLNADLLTMDRQIHHGQCRPWRRRHWMCMCRTTCHPWTWTPKFLGSYLRHTGVTADTTAVRH